MLLSEVGLEIGKLRTMCFEECGRKRSDTVAESVEHLRLYETQKSGCHETRLS
jgi:hypothetical protein